MNIIKAIRKINPNAEVVIIGEDINTCEIEWHNGTTPIPKADIEAINKILFDDDEIQALIGV